MPPPHIDRFTIDNLVNRESGKSVYGKIKAKGILLTWMLPVQMVDTSTAVRNGEPTALVRIVNRLRTCCAVMDIWQDIQDHAHLCMKAAGGSDVAVCLEVCPTTWAEERIVRLHFHAFVKSSSSDLRCKHMAPFNFRDVKPHASTCIGGLNMSTNSCGSWAGFFYCCLRQKLGTLHCQATRLPYVGFLVNPTWILNLVQAGKLAPNDARSLLVRCANASRHVKELEAHEVHMEELAVGAAEAEAYRQLGSSLKPQKEYAIVNAWLAQFEQALHRYKFLVLQGPSRLGKTAFARSLCGPSEETLEINCAAGTEPDLRAYRLSRHGLILFDEIVPQQVVAQRKVFQAQSAKVQLGCSATNMYSYDIFIWRKKLVLASNNWDMGMAHLEQADQDWLKANSFVLRVVEPMWEE